MAGDSSLQKLVAAEKAAREIVDRARAEADTIVARSREAAAERAAGCQADMSRLRQDAEKALGLELELERRASEERVREACEGIEARSAAHRAGAVQAMVRELTAS